MTPEQTAMAKPIFTPSDGQKHVMEMQHWLGVSHSKSALIECLWWKGASNQGILRFS
jgi:hypothetical protein